jgi:hypothetical protein
MFKKIRPILIILLGFPFFTFSQQLVSNISYDEFSNFTYDGNILDLANIVSDVREFETVEKDNLVNPQQPKLGKFIPITGNIKQLEHFFSELKKSKNKKIRIAHYGDSLLLGDIITEYLREKFQDKYSGKGIGFLSIVADDYRMRRSIMQSYSDDWQYASFVSRNPEQFPFGINGTVAKPKPGSWVKYESTPMFKATSSFDIVKVFYSNADRTSSLKYSIDKSSPQKLNFEPGDNIQQVVINKPNSKTFELQFIDGKAPFIYGISLESSTGIIIDNFPMRGNSGASLADISTKTLADFNSLMDYDLIIFNYGANVSSPNKGIYTVYENKMVSVIEEFKKIFPKTSFLLVSVADKTVKRGSQFITNPDVPVLLESQKKIAGRTNIAFWNLWEAMGGNNSMKDWVDAAPPQALKDYAHFTTEGGTRVAELLFEAIMDADRK